MHVTMMTILLLGMKACMLAAASSVPKYAESPDFTQSPDSAQLSQSCELQTLFARMQWLHRSATVAAM